MNAKLSTIILYEVVSAFFSDASESSYRSRMCVTVESPNHALVGKKNFCPFREVKGVQI